MSGPFNAADYLVRRHVTEGRGDRTAVCAPETLTYAELDRRVGDVAAAYRRLGLRRDDRVLMVMSDDVPMLTAILGAFRTGVVAVPVSTMFNGRELGTLLADSGARAAVVTHEYVDAVGQALKVAPEVEHVVLHGTDTIDAPSSVRVHRWDDFVAAGAGGDTGTADTDDDSWALWLYTSGTTGSPKAAMHRHANIRHVCETYGRQVLGILPADRTFSIAKMFFAYGIGNSVFF
ncbi:MAG: AMP-binding protein, partial [Nocardioidaceae bacterium]